MQITFPETKTSSVSQTDFEQLPIELQIMIFEYLKFFDLHRFSLTSKYYKQLIQNELMENLYFNAVFEFKYYNSFTIAFLLNNTPLCNKIITRAQEDFYNDVINFREDLINMNKETICHKGKNCNIHRKIGYHDKFPWEYINRLDCKLGNIKEWCLSNYRNCLVSSDNIVNIFTRILDSKYQEKGLITSLDITLSRRLHQLGFQPSTYNLLKDETILYDNITAYINILSNKESFVLDTLEEDFDKAKKYNAQLICEFLDKHIRYANYKQIILPRIEHCLHGVGFYRILLTEKDNDRSCISTLKNCNPRLYDYYISDSGSGSGSDFSWDEI